MDRPSTQQTTPLTDFELDHSFGMSLRDETPVSSSSDPNQQLLEELADLSTRAGTAGDAASATQLSEILVKTSADALAAAIRALANTTERKRLLCRIADTASPRAILVTASAAAGAYGHRLSPVLEALLVKLAREAEELPDGIRINADHSYRDLFRNIVDDWSGASVDRVSTGFDSLFSEQKTDEPKSHAGSVAPEAERILAMALETGSGGSMVWTALADLSRTQEGVRSILDMLKRAPAGSRSAATIASQFATPQRLAMLLVEDPVDFEAVDALLTSMGDAAAPALIDALAESKSRAARRGLLDRLAAIGPTIGPLATNRLQGDERWYVQRNMLTVMREAKCDWTGIQLEKYTGHADARVRREATQLLFNDPVSRDRALASALRDSDVGMLKVGLKAARESMPESVVPILAKRVVDPQFPPEFRTSALQLLARSSSVLALEALLRFAMSGTTLMGRPKLAPKTPEMLIALSGLARAWPNERRSAPLLAVARDQKDPDIAAAAAARAPVVDDRVLRDD